MQNAEKQEAPAVKELPLPHRQVLSLIPHASENAVTSAYIQKLTGFSNTTVREVISKLILTYGYPVGTTNKRSGRQGYYIITNENEKKDTIRNLKGRAEKITARYQALENINI